MRKFTFEYVLTMNQISVLTTYAPCFVAVITKRITDGHSVD